MSQEGATQAGSSHKGGAGPDPQKHKKGDNQMKWFFVGCFESMGFGYDEYTNEDNTKCWQVWDDGYEEIFEIS